MDQAEVRERATLLEGLDPAPGDSLLALIGMVRRDPRPHKIDLGVGVYRDPAGGTPISWAPRCARAASGSGSCSRSAPCACRAARPERRWI